MSKNQYFIIVKKKKLLNKMDSKQYLKCKKHSNKEILFVKVNNIKDGDDVLFCDQCLFSKSNFSMDDCAPLKQILDQNDESPIFNLFPFNDQDLIKQLKEIFQMNNCDELPIQINQFYDNLKEKIIQMIDESKKKSLILAQQLSDLKLKAIEKYNQTVDISKIKNMFSSKNSNLDEIHIQFKQYLKQIFLFQDMNNTQSLKELATQQEKIYQDLKLVQYEMISSNLLQIKNENNFLENFQTVLPQKIDLMPSLQFTKVSKGSQMQNLDDYLKINDSSQINFSSSNNQQRDTESCFFESNIVMHKKKVYVFRFQIGISNSIQFCLCSINKKQQPNQEIRLNAQQSSSSSRAKKNQQPQQVQNSQLFGQQVNQRISGTGNSLFGELSSHNKSGLISNQSNNLGLFSNSSNSSGLFATSSNNQALLSNQQNNQGNEQNQFESFSIQFRNQVNQQLRFEQAQHQINSQSFILQQNKENQIEIKIFISRGIYEVRDYPNSSNVATLSQQYENQLKNSQNEFKFYIRGNLILIKATESEYDFSN